MSTQVLIWLIVSGVVLGILDVIYKIPFWVLAIASGVSVLLMNLVGVL